jgi:hypothetical protein
VWVRVGVSGAMGLGEVVSVGILTTVKAAKTKWYRQGTFANAQRFSNRRYNYICAKNITCECEGLHHMPEIFRYTPGSPSMSNERHSRKVRNKS